MCLRRRWRLWSRITPTRSTRRKPQPCHDAKRVRPMTDPAQMSALMATAPELLLAVGAMALLMLGAFRGERVANVADGIAIAFLVAAAVIVARLPHRKAADAADVRISGDHPALGHRHADADFRGRPDRALPRARADESVPLRACLFPARPGARVRGGVEVFRAGRALLRHAALRRLAHFRLR